MSLRTAVGALLSVALGCGLSAQTGPQLSFSSPVRVVYACDYDASAIAVDATGNIFVAGHYDTCYGPRGMWVAKINPRSSQLLWPTSYIPTNDTGNSRLGLVLDRSGNAFLVGRTNNPDLSAYFDAIAGSLRGGSDILIAKFSPDGRTPWAMYLGGTGWESFGGIGIDRDENIYIAGETSSLDFPVLNGQSAQFSPGFNDLFAAKLARDGTLLYGTHLGGSIFNASGVSPDGAARVVAADSVLYALDPAGNLLFRLDPSSGFALPFTPASLAVDEVGNAYLTGPNLWNAYPEAPQPFNDVWVAKLSLSGDIVYEKRITGSAQDQPRALAIDTLGHAYVTGFTQSADYPLVSGLQTQRHGQQDAFVTTLTPDGSALLYSTFLGGSDNMGNGTRKDGSLAITVRGNDTYFAGLSSSTDFPLVSPLDSYYSYAGQAFVSVIALPDYSVQLLFDTDKAHHVGSTAPIKLALFDENGSNVSSPDLMVTPIRLTRIGDSTASVVEDTGQANADSTFRFDDSLAPGGGYIFNLSTRGLSSGSYQLALSIGTDAYVYQVPLQLK